MKPLKLPCGDSQCHLFQSDSVVSRNVGCELVEQKQGTRGKQEKHCGYDGALLCACECALCTHRIVPPNTSIPIIVMRASLPAIYACAANGANSGNKATCCSWTSEGSRCSRALGVISLWVELCSSDLFHQSQEHLQCVRQNELSGSSRCGIRHCASSCSHVGICLLRARVAYLANRGRVDSLHPFRACVFAGLPPRNG
jgi:hypothetical protein